MAGLDHWRRRCFFVLATITLAPVWAAAQPLQNERYELSVPAKAVGEEAATQPKLYTMEVHFKPMRFIEVEVTDPATGKKQTKTIWYLVYKAINRPLPAPAADPGRTPANDDDREPAVPLFVPRFELQTDDVTNGVPVQNLYADVIVPEAEPVIARRERRRFKNSVDIIQPLPQVVAPGDETDDNTLYGVAMWSDIPKDTDYFTVYMSGFSNGYRYVRGPVDFGELQNLMANKTLLPTDAVWVGAQKIKSVSEVCDWKAPTSELFIEPDPWLIAGGVPGLYETVSPVPDEYRNLKWMYTITPDRFAGQAPPNVWRKVIRQHFTKYGDRFKDREDEFRPCGDPVWIYQPQAKPQAAGEQDAKSTTAQHGQPDPTAVHLQG